nr:membrane protein insertion efficiency factor YidD [Kineosporia sp. NBRC 101731]
MAEQPAGSVTPWFFSRGLLHRGAELVVGAARRILGVPRLLIIGFLILYRLLVSPLYGQTCRFYPSCSQYALTAVQQHGALRGSWLAGRRLLRCNPWNAGGVDHVPPVRSKSGCEPGAHETMPIQADSPAPLAAEPESNDSRADSRVAPTDQNCAPSASRRAA